MKKALNDMKQYIEAYKLWPVMYCRGCKAVSICNECIQTQTEQLNIEDYMRSKCRENHQKMLDIMARYPDEYGRAYTS
jgi:hypothetical protein